jgi:hypothetical protein
MPIILRACLAAIGILLVSAPVLAGPIFTPGLEKEQATQALVLFTAFFILVAGVVCGLSLVVFKLAGRRKK